MTSVSRSCSSAFNPSSIIIPLTSSERSLPPTPSPWETPSPAWAKRHITCCKPLPDAETSPTLPLGTALANPKGAPLTTAVPQSGPIMKRPRFLAYCFRLTSSSMGTLSLNISTWRPKSRAFLASRAAYSPGTEMMARFASGKALTAPSNDLGR